MHALRDRLHSYAVGTGAWLIAAGTASLAIGQGLAGLTRWEEGRSMRVGSNVWIEDDLYDGKNNMDRPDRIEPGDTYVMADLEGPGVITHIWMTFLQEPHFWVTDGAANHQEMLIRIYWDGRPKPDVEAPVGDFFACCFGRRMEVISVPVIVEDGDSYNCFWHMPFRKSARIEIVNQSKKPIRKLYNNVDWVKKKSLPENTMYFCASASDAPELRHSATTKTRTGAANRSCTTETLLASLDRSVQTEGRPGVATTIGLWVDAAHPVVHVTVDIMFPETQS